MRTTYDNDRRAAQRCYGPQRWLWTILALGIIALVVYALARLYPGPGGAEGTPIAEILANPQQSYGDVVTVRSHVDRVLGAGAFVIGSADLVIYWS